MTIVYIHHLAPTDNIGIFNTAAIIYASNNLRTSIYSEYWYLATPLKTHIVDTAAVAYACNNSPHIAYRTYWYLATQLDKHIVGRYMCTKHFVT